ncbi:MAG: sporulation protein YunB, partial [Firmicutes bacterium]|nr:sporulation protein YunB [Bacillota bacterium]
GPQVPVALIGGGVVEAEVADALTSVGINQSRHSIQLHLTAHLQLLSPLTDEAVEVKSTLLLAESVIVGPVPQVYLGTGGGLLGAGGGP